MDATITQTLQREPKAERTKRGRGDGAKLELGVYLYKAADGEGPDFGSFYGRDADGPWELHFANDEERDTQLGRILGQLDDVATQAREEAEERAPGTTVWLKSIGAVGQPIEGNWWEGPRDREGGVDFPYRPRSVKDGDLLVLYGSTLGVVVGVMRVKGDWYAGGETDRWKYRIDGDIIARVPVSQGIPLESLSDEREITKSIRQKSHIRLSDAEAARALDAFGIDRAS
jgi:hypothetical protein